MLSDEIKKRVRGEVYTAGSMLDEYSHDASIFEIRPAVVVSPVDARDVEELVKLAVEASTHGESVSLTPRAAGTDMSGGSLTESISLNMTAHFNKIHEITLNEDKKSGSAVVDPGVYYRDFDKETRRRDLFMPAYPASRELAAIGGMVGNNAGGEKTPAYGKVENFVTALHIVLADGIEHVIKPLTKAELEQKINIETFEGQIYKQMYELITKNQEVIDKARPGVSKNSAGYYLWNIMNEDGGMDLTRLLVGSQGTLGIMTQITLRLEPVPKASEMLVVFVRDMKRLGEVISGLHEARPESLESYDDKTLKLVLKYFKEFVKLMGRRNIFSLLWQFIPEFLLILTRGFPRMVIMAEFTGDNASSIQPRINKAAQAMRGLGMPFRLVTNPEESDKYWTMRRQSFSLMRNKLKGRHTAPFIDDFAVPPDSLPEFLPKLTAILDSYGFAYGMAGHPGDGNFHIFPMLRLEDEAERAIIPKLSDEVYNLVLEYKGTITAEHNDGLIRTPYLEKMYGKEVVALFAEVKKIFDPHGIFNPGKKVGGSLGYSMAHIRRSF